jgi:hypothetical protein
MFVQEASKIFCNVQVTLKLSYEYPPTQNMAEKGNPPPFFSRGGGVEYYPSKETLLKLIHVFRQQGHLLIFYGMQHNLHFIFHKMSFVS